MFGDFLLACWRRLLLRKSASTTGNRPAPRRPLPLGLENLEDRLTPAVAANDLFVGTVYDGLLGRPIDATGQSYWSPRLSIGGSTAAHQNVASQIANSDEALNRDVQLFYSTFLLRAPDTAGQSFWFQQLKNGASLNQVRAGLLGSDEFFGLVGSTNSKFLDAVYRLELGRAIDATGQSFWLQRLSAGQSRVSVVQQILASTEANNEKVTNFYQDILGHAPDSTGLSFWSKQLSSGTSEQTVVSGFLSSDEYLNDISTFAGSTTMTMAAGAAAQFIANNKLFTGPLPNAEELAGNVATTQIVPFVIANNDFYNVTFNTALGVSATNAGVLANDVDSSGQPLHVTTPGTIGTPKGSLLLRSDGTFVYTPTAGQTGLDTITYTASDANNVSNAATITFNIANSVPITVNDGYNVTFNSPLTVPTAQGILSNDSDPDGEAIAVTSPGTFNTAKGTLALNSDGSFTYTPNGGATGQDQFTYTVSDPNGISQPATVYFTIAAPNGSSGDRFEPNQTSDQATDFGVLPSSTTFSFTNLSITNTNTGLPDFDWYKWTTSTGNTFNATINTTTGGPLEMHIFTLQNGTLVELAGTTSGKLSVGVTANQVVFVEVLGQNTAPGVMATGNYNLAISLNP